MKSHRETVENRSFISFRCAMCRDNYHCHMNTQGGFSLIELIVTIIIIAIFGSMIIVFYGSSIIKSSDPITRLRKTSDLHKIMENITADYNKYPKWRSETYYSVMNTVIIPANVNGHGYRCNNIGTTGSSEPVWPLVASGTVNDGIPPNHAVWTENGKVHDANSLTTLKNNIGAEGTSQDNSYGKYTVELNRFIQFNATTGTETSSATNEILKVTIKNDIGETLTVLFMADYLL